MDKRSSLRKFALRGVSKQRQDSDQTALYHPGIRRRLRWSYLLSSTLPLVIVGVLLIGIHFRSQQQAVRNAQISLATRAARDISAYISNIETQVLRFGQNIGDMSPDQLHLAAQGLLQTNSPDLHELVIFDANGTFIGRFAHQPIVNFAAPRNTSSDALIDAALQGRGGRSSIYRTDDEQILFTTVMPLRVQGTVIGAISATISAARINQLLRPLDSDPVPITTYLLNERHEVMLSSGPEWHLLPVLDNMFSTDAQISEYRGGNNQKMIGARAVVNPVNWWVIAEQPARQAFISVWRSVTLLALLVVIVGIGALSLGLFQAETIVRPLAALRVGALELGAGHLDYRIDMDRTDELGQLAETFNTMARQLQHSLSQIEQQNEWLRHGLMLARDIQVGLLPTIPPWNNQALEVYARSIPAYEVGGDFYTYLVPGHNQAAIAVGDISGKGVAAALLMALTSSMIEAQARVASQPSAVFQALNQLLSSRLKSSHMNAALIYAVFDLQRHTMTVANAGMIAPLLIHIGKAAANESDSTAERSCQFIDVGGLPIGTLPNAVYHDSTVMLEPGDIVLFVSDGVVEARNPDGDLFGFERLEQLITSATDLHVLVHLVALIQEQVQKFMGAAEQHDDITIVAVRPDLRSTALVVDAISNVITAYP